MSEEKLPRKQVSGYITGMIPLTIIIGVFRLGYIKFFFDSLGLNEVLFIIGMTIFMVINMLNDPLIGQWQDNTDVKKWGSRRIVYIKWFSPLLVIVFAFMWFPWSTDAATPMGQFVMFLHFLITISIFDTLSNIVTMAWMALLPDMTSNLGERTKINFLGSILALFASFAVITVPTMVDNLEFFQMFNIVVAIISYICYVLVVKLSKESPEYQGDRSPPLWTAIKQTMKSKSFMMFVGFNFFKTMIASIQLSYVFLFLIIIGPENIGLYFLIVIIVGWSSNILCMRLRKKFGFKKLLLRFTIIQFVGGFIFFFLVLIPAISTPAIWIGLVFSAFFGGAGVFGVIMQTLPIDEDEVKYGSRREGMFYGINALFTKPTESIGPIIVTIVLALTGYVAGSTVQTESAIFGIIFVFYFIVNIFVALSLIFVHYFPLEGEKLQELEAQLQELHQKKRDNLQQE
ncbi:MAG: MFS transporter [Candidatus Lokiarchaeota archaeon]|nr:MFS transporter [Candidatus Lokiarchaeota archaeon]